MRIFYKSYKKKKEIRRTNFERKISINSHSQNEDYPVLSLIINPNTVILSTITPCFPIATSIHHLSTKNPRSKNPVKESSTHKAFLSLSLSLYKFRDTTRTTFMHDLPNFSMRLHEEGRKEGTGGWRPVSRKSDLPTRSVQFTPLPLEAIPKRRGMGRLNAHGPSKGSITQDLARGNYRNCTSTRAPRTWPHPARGELPLGKKEVARFLPTVGYLPVSWYY